MPIYAYRCSACGYQNDYLQKISEPLLSECPECGKSTFQKQVTAAGFQLKGTGWYATDFKNSGKGKSAPAKEESGKEQSKSSESKSGESKSSGEGSSSSGEGGSKPDAKPDVSASGAGASPACS